MKDMRKTAWTLAIVICAAVLLIGCGKKDAADVVSDLSSTLGKLESYEGTGTMTLHTGQQPLTYSVEVWYRKPHYYRIALTNAKQDVTQIVLKNDDGVFVLTPQLGKTFRFQSDWPNRHGQAYLYHTLAQSILDDDKRQFAVDGDTYVFDVASNLQHNTLVRQRIWLDKSNLAPVRVEASDAEANVLLEVKFNSFTFGKKFEADSFDMKRNLTGYELRAVPTLGEADISLEDGQTGKPQGSFGILVPAYVPEGVVRQEIREVALGEEMGVLLRYSGEYSFTLLESRPTDRAVTALTGTIVDLGHSVGVLLGEENRTLTWMQDGVEFRLTSGDLPEEEMIKIAQSLEGQVGK